jgi:pilus assembly protein FimV
VASALGLGEIEMQSALNQRLDAEIPLRGVPEDDSSRIIVSLASEEAFRQVGLQRPFSLTRLSFAVKQRDSGGYYVHVTSREPIVEPFLSFLIEVDWPEGNLLREYTVLLDPPVFVSDEPKEEPAAAADAPAVTDEDESMAAGVPADIERDVAPEAVAEPEPEPEATAEAEAPATDADDAIAAESRRVEGDFSDTPVFLQVEQAEERAEAEARAMAEADAEAEAEAEQVGEAEPTTAGYDAAGDEYGPVQRGEALWNIASRLKRDDMTVQQMMLALLRYNPEAFVDDNINRMRQGYVLRIPDAEAVLSLSAQQAIARVREQNALWQEYRRALRGGTGPAQQQASADAETSATVSGEDAGLKIVGSEEGTGAGSDQDASATAGGGQAAEQLQLAREQLESARMEKDELESRVGELEETVSKMERLIELREDELARLQDQLRRIEEGADPSEVLADAGDAAAESVDGEETTEAEDGVSAGEAGEQAADAADETATATAGEGTDTDADTAAAEDGAETAETGEAADSDATAAADADQQETVGQADGGSAQTAPATADDGGVTTVRTQPSEPGIMERVSGTIGSIGRTIGGLVAGLGLGGVIPEPFVLPAVGAIVVLLLLGAMLAVRRSRAGLDEDADEDVIDTDAESMLAAGGDDSREDFSALFDEDDTVAADDTGLTDSLETEASELAGGDDDAGDAEAELMSESFDLEGLDDTDETITTGAESGDDDTIAEADVYLAYGLHQQAEDLLNLAIEEQPERADYRAKLLEAIYGGGRSEDFVEQARALRERVEDTENDPNWLRVVAMGKELAPNEGMFEQEVDESLKPTGAGAAQPPETDLDLGGDDDSTDLDFSFDDDEGSAEEIDEKDDDTFAQTMIVDSDSLASDDAEPGEAESGITDASGDEMDFDLGDLDLGDADETSDAAGETPAAEASTEEEDSADFDLGDFDLGEEDDSSTPDTGAGEPAGETAGEEEDALADFDLGDLEDSGDSGDSGEGAEEPVSLESESDDFDFDLDETDADVSPAGEADTEMEAGEIDLGDLELEDDASGTSATDESAADDDEDALDFDLGDEAGETDDESTSAGLDPGDDTELVDMDLGDLEESSGAGSGEEGGGEEISLADSDEDVSLDDLTEGLAADDSGLVGPDTGEGEATADLEATGDSGQAAGTGDAGGDEEEYGTMLDLARAYIDMGDAESARSALEEVAESGNAEQRSEAQGLLDSI